MQWPKPFPQLAVGHDHFIIQNHLSKIVQPARSPGIRFRVLLPMLPESLGIRFRLPLKGRRLRSQRSENKSTSTFAQKQGKQEVYSFITPGAFLPQSGSAMQMMLHALQSYFLSPHIVSEANYKLRSPCILTLVH